MFAGPRDVKREEKRVSHPFRKKRGKGWATPVTFAGPRDVKKKNEYPTLSAKSAERMGHPRKGRGSFDSSSASLGVAQDFAWRLRRRQNGSRWATHGWVFPDSWPSTQTPNHSLLH